MATENEISSTEKLLKVIRRSSEDKNSQQQEFTQPGFREPARQRWLPLSSRDFLGVEIFRDRLNLVCMSHRKNGWQAIDAASAPMPEGISLEHQDFPFFLKSQLQRIIRSRKTDIWICLPPSKGEIWKVNVPKVKKGLTNAVYWSARKEKTFDENEYFFDYRITDEITDQGVQKLVAEACIASAREIRLYKRIFSETGYQLAGITLPAFSLENLFVHKWIDPGDNPYAVLYIGEEASYIDIHGRHTTLFNRVIKTGRDSILDSLVMESGRREQESPEMEEQETEGPPDTRALADRQQAARQLKQMEAQAPQEPTGGTGQDLAGQGTFDLIRPALERLARQLERTIDHSVNVLSHPAPERIYICGGISFLPGLEDFFTDQLGMPAVVMNFLEPESAGSGGKISLQDRDERLSLVSTAALAMPSAKTINFLHTAVDRDKEKQALRNTNVIAAACALLFVLSAGWLWAALHELEQTRQQTAAVEQQLEKYSPRIEPEDLARLAGELEEHKNEVRAYSRKLRPVAVLKELTRLTPQHVKLINVRMDPGAGANTKGKNREGTLTVEGFISSGPDMFETHLTGYLLRLRRSPLFQDSAVQKSERDTLHTGDNVYRFTVNVSLRQV